MKKVLSLFFVLVSLLGGCAQENTTSKIDENTSALSGEKQQLNLWRNMINLN